jgi:hypothetical protein
MICILLRVYHKIINLTVIPSTFIASHADMWQYITVQHLKMVLGPKHVLAVTTEENEDCCVDGIIMKLITYSSSSFETCVKLQRL